MAGARGTYGASVPRWYARFAIGRRVIRRALCLWRSMNEETLLSLSVDEFQSDRRGNQNCFLNRDCSEKRAGRRGVALSLDGATAVQGIRNTSSTRLAFAGIATVRRVGRSLSPLCLFSIL